MIPFVIVISFFNIDSVIIKNLLIQNNDKENQIINIITNILVNSFIALDEY